MEGLRVGYWDAGVWGIHGWWGMLGWSMLEWDLQWYKGLGCRVSWRGSTGIEGCWGRNMQWYKGPGWRFLGWGAGTAIEGC